MESHSSETNTETIHSSQINTAGYLSLRVHNAERDLVGQYLENSLSIASECILFLVYPAWGVNQSTNAWWTSTIVYGHLVSVGHMNHNLGIFFRFDQGLHVAEARTYSPSFHHSCGSDLCAVRDTCPRHWPWQLVTQEEYKKLIFFGSR